MRPLVGIPPCLDDRGRWRPGRTYHYLDAAYAISVASAGGTPLYCPHQSDVTALVERVDGLLIPGGGDLLPPSPYPAEVRFHAVSETQLEFDRRLLAAALERSVPVLGICYGMQLLALHYGGTLHYDIPTDLPEAESHQLREADGRHAIDVTAGSRLARILGTGPGAVNSRHHQAVAAPGELRVSARARDGVVEAVERDCPAFCVGVQWHPESMEESHRAHLFGAFVSACREG